MKNYIKIFFIRNLLLLTILSIISFTNKSKSEEKNFVELNGKLKVEGNYILNQNGEPVVLRGMSLFWSQIKGKYYNEKCVEWLKNDWKCTVVRAAMGVEKADELDGYLAHKDREISKVIRVINSAIDNGIYVIVDWHDHHAHNNIDEAKEFFEIIAKTFGDKPNIIYEIYNEPLQISWNEIVKPYSEEIIKVIRKYDEDNLIFVGTPSWSQDVDVASQNPIEYTNIAYTLHFYASSHKEELRNKAKIALQNNVALFVSEFGTCEYTGDGFIDTLEVERWFSFMEDNKIGWCNWAIGDKNESSAALKSGANSEGNWGQGEISFSGNLIRNKLIELNKVIK